MAYGKIICEELKAIRRRIAVENGIEYAPVECHHEGECSGTCPACEAEVRYLEGELRHRSRLGHAIMLGGVAVGLSALSSCTDCSGIGQVDGYMEPDTCDVVIDNPDTSGTDEVLVGEVVAEDVMRRDSMSEARQMPVIKEIQIVGQDTLAEVAEPKSKEVTSPNDNNVQIHGEEEETNPQPRDSVAK